MRLPHEKLNFEFLNNQSFLSYDLYVSKYKKTLP